MGDREFMLHKFPAVIGVGRTKFGEHYEKDHEKLVEESWLKASDAAGIERKDLDAVYSSDYFLQITNKVESKKGSCLNYQNSTSPWKK